MEPLNNTIIESASSITIKAFNVNSIGKNPKRRQIFNSLKKKECDIFVLQWIIINLSFASYEHISLAALFFLILNKDPISFS